MTFNKEAVLNLAIPDPELLQVLQSSQRQRPQIDYSDPGKAIAQLRAGQNAYLNARTTDPGVESTTLHFNARDGYELRLCVHSPVIGAGAGTGIGTSAATPRPLIVLYHGGGSTIGEPENLTTLCRRFVKELDVVCVAPQYRLAPEWPFPQQAYDAWDALEWIAENAMTALPADLSKGFVVGGVSAGGKLAAVVSHLARDRGLSPALTGVWLSAASVVSKSVVPWKYKSRYLAQTQEACLNAPVLDKQFAKITADALKADEYSALAAPLNWPTGHVGLPRTYFDICGLDIVRDDSLVFEALLRDECAVETRSNVYPGMPHIFWQYFPTLSQTKRWEIETTKGMGWLLRIGEEARI